MKNDAKSPWTKEFWYCFIATEQGYRAVTSYKGKFIEWNENEKPLVLEEYFAKECATRIIVNFRKALAVCLPYELRSQADV